MWRAGAPRNAVPGVGPTLPTTLKAALTRTRSAWWLLRRGGRLDRSGLRILFYHRVADEDDPLAVSLRQFREQMELLAAYGYEVVGLAEAVELLERGFSPARTIALNFDDGFRDVAENALPTLERLGFRATVFVPTGVIDGTAAFPWYRRQPPVLQWDEIRQLDDDGTLRFEAHSVTHPNLIMLEDDAARYEISRSKVDLEARLERPVEAFCYPAGLFGDRERRRGSGGRERAPDCRLMEYTAPPRSPRAAVMSGIGLLAGALALSAFAAELAFLLSRHPPSALVLT